jgi:hypothetical protein
MSSSKFSSRYFRVVTSVILETIFIVFENDIHLRIPLFCLTRDDRRRIAGLRGPRLGKTSCVFSVTTHSRAPATIATSRRPVWYSFAVGSGGLDRESNLFFVLPI